MDYSNLNKYQTELDSELIDAIPKDLYADLIEYIDSVAMIKHLISPPEVRGYIADRPFKLDGNDEIDSRGRREVDQARPHILEDMDFFRERAMFYEENGRYNNLMANGNPQSDYAKFWKQELLRCKFGLVRSDGEWIPGQLYFYWNYSPIWLVETTEKL